MSVDHEALFERVIEINSTAAWDRLGEILTDDYVEEYPQSGELIRGLENARAVRANYPGGLADPTRSVGLDRSTVRLATADEQWVVGPTYMPVRVEGSGNVGTMVIWNTYPDASRWLVVSMYELRGDKIAHVQAFFAPAFDPPDWRAPYREAVGR